MPQFATDPRAFLTQDHEFLTQKQVFDFLLCVFHKFINNNDLMGNDDIRSPLEINFNCKDNPVDFSISRNGMFSSRYGAIDEIYFFSCINGTSSGSVYVGRYQNGLDQSNRPIFEYHRTYKNGSQTDVEMILNTLKHIYELNGLTRNI